MKILFDIGHPAQLNFYKHAIIKLAKDHKIFLTYVNRGILPKIINKELGNINNCKLIKIGRHRGSLPSVIFEMNIIRPFLLFIAALRINPEIAISSGYQAGIYPKLARKKSIHFSDDPERSKLFIGLMKFFASEIYMPFYSDSKINDFKGLKEWAYLTPDRFSPNPEILKEYYLEAKSYIFIREVSTGTANYSKQEAGVIEKLAFKIPKSVKVVLSLEDKSRIKKFPENWIILNEPVKDIYSLMYFARIIISSGDSMAREGAQLGVPSFYCGNRKMVANEILSEKKLLTHIPLKDLIDNIAPYFNNEVSIEALKNSQYVTRRNLADEWNDITELILSKVNKYDH